MYGILIRYRSPFSSPPPLYSTFSQQNIVWCGENWCQPSFAAFSPGLFTPINPPHGCLLSHKELHGWCQEWGIPSMCVCEEKKKWLRKKKIKRYWECGQGQIKRLSCLVEPRGALRPFQLFLSSSSIHGPHRVHVHAHKRKDTLAHRTVLLKGINERGFCAIVCVFCVKEHSTGVWLCVWLACLRLFAGAWQNT